MFWRRRMDHDLDSDIEHFIELETEENIALGMPPDAARYAALRKFGNIGRVKEETRSVWVWAPLDTLWGDIRHAFRRMRRSPGTAALVILSLALALAPAVTVFAIMDRLFLSRAPVRAPEQVQVIAFRDLHPGAPYRLRYPTYAEFREFKRSLHSFSGLAYHERKQMAATLNGRTRVIFGHLISDGYFDVLGLRLQAGPGPSMAVPGVIISDSLWRREFGGRRDAIGKAIVIDGQPFTIRGVAEPEMRGVLEFAPCDIWIPVQSYYDSFPHFRSAAERGDRAADSRVLARLRPGTSPAAAGAEVVAVALELLRNRQARDADLAGFTFPLNSPEAGGEGGPKLTAVAMLVLGILLAVACANIMGVLLANAEERRRETAVRQALGASRGRLMREWMIESCLLSSVAAVLGMFAARALIGIVPELMPSLTIPLNFEFSFGPRVWAYAISMVALSTLAFAVVPAWRGSRPDLLMGLRRDTGISVLKVRVPLRSVLIVAQIAAAEVVLFAGGLALEWLNATRRIDPGFDPKRPVAMVFVAPASEESRPAAIDRESLAARLAGIAGVRRAAYGNTMPLSWMKGPALQMEAAGHEARKVFGGAAGPGLFSTIGARFLSGRDLGRLDARGVIVNVPLARILAPDGNVVGRQIRLNGTQAEIVGVFADIPWESIHDTGRPRAISLAPARAGGNTTFVVEAVGDPERALARLRDELAVALPGAVLGTPKTLAQLYQDALFFERIVTRLLYGIGLLAALLTATGLHGITAALFAKRNREFAIRLVAGAAPRQIVRTVLSSALRLTAIGITVGLVIAMPGALLLRAELHGFSPWSLPAFGLSTAIVVLTALTAGAQPASRVLRIQPADVLRAE